MILKVILIIIASIIVGSFVGTMVYKTRKTKGNPFGEIFVWLLHVVVASTLIFFIGFLLTLL